MTTRPSLTPFAVALAWILIATVSAPLPSSAEDQCKQWVVSPEWRLWQGNGVRVLMKLEQTLTILKGQASYPIPHSADRTGIVTGTVEKDRVKLEITWVDGQVNIFSGTVDPEGMIGGNTYDKAKPESKETWFSDDKAMRCADTASKPSAQQTPATTPTP